MESRVPAVSPSGPAPPVSPHLLTQLESFGYPHTRALKALAATHSKNIDTALAWLTDHENDPDIDAQPASSTPISPASTNATSTGVAASSTSSSVTHNTAGTNAAQTSSSAATSSTTAPALPNFDPAFMQSLLSAIGQQPGVPYKMVLAVRQDLGMKTGKIAAQCAHAAVGMYQHLSETSPKTLEPWLEGGQMKVVVKVKDLAELTEVQKAAEAVGVPTYAIHDAGRTQVAAGSLTVLAVGPAPIPLVDQVTGTLKLL